jgi:hypothetical protein
MILLAFSLGSRLINNARCASLCMTVRAASCTSTARAIRLDRLDRVAS